MSFMRTLRVSETGLNALPPGFGRFSLRNVAAPLGAGATVEEQLQHAPPVGGIQVQVWELTPEAPASA